MRSSVAIATYNGEKYIIAQLRSILGQTEPVDEVVITDDRSTDHTVEMIEKFIEDNKLAPHWSVSVNAENLGFAENFRRAIDLTSGDVIFLCDQDDIWLEDRVARMGSSMQRQPEIGVLTTKYTAFADENEEDSSERLSAGSSDAERIAFSPHNRFLRSLGCVMCVRRNFYERIRSYWYEGWAHDEFLWCMSILTGQCYSLDYCSLKHRVHQQQYSGHLGHSKEKRIEYLEHEVFNSKFLYDAAGELNAALQSRYERFIKAHEYRLELVKGKKIYRAFQLLFYLPYYYSPKSYLVELKMAARGRQ